MLFTGGVLSFNGYISSISGCLVVLVTQSRYIESYKKMFKGSTVAVKKYILFSDINIEFEMFGTDIQIKMNMRFRM